MPLRAFVPAFVAIFMMAATPGNTATIELDDSDQFDFSDGFLDNGDTATSLNGRLTITFNNIVTSDGLPGAQIDEDGIYLGRDPIDFAVVTMELIFSADVILTAYDIDFVFFEEEDPVATFALAGPNGLGGNGVTGNNDLTQDPSGPVRQPFDMGTISFFQAGETYTLTHTVFGTGVSQIDELDFRLLAPIPLPAGALLLGGGLLAFGALSWARRRRVA